MSASPLDGHLSNLYSLISEGFSNSEIAAKLTRDFGIETSEASVRRAIARNASLQDAYEHKNLRLELEGRTEAPGIKFHENDTIEVTLPFSEEGKGLVEHLSIEDVMQRHGLLPEEWEAERALPNVWEANAGRDPVTGEAVKLQLYQFKIWFKKKVALRLVFPAVVGPKIAAPKPIDENTYGLLTVVATDQQNPFRLEGLHELFLRWLAYNQPDRGIVAGDLLDNGYISRHRDDPAWDTPVQTCLQTSFDTLYDYRNAYEDCSWTLIRGNHDIRIRNEMLERAERLYGVTAAQYPGDEGEEWVYSLNHLLHLKRLGVSYVEPLGTYEYDQVPITDLIAVRHGHKTVKDGALKTSEELGHSVVLGHTHRQSILRKTKWNSLAKSWRVVTAIESGCMCQIEGGLGYANAGAPDWQPGFSTITSWPDGGFTFDLATYEQEGVLRWRDQVLSL